MCNSCFSKGLNRRQFIGRTIKVSGSLTFALAGGLSAMGSDFLIDYSKLSPFPGTLKRLIREPARVRVVFLYPPADVVNEGRNEDTWARHNWFTWPGNQFEPERQEQVLCITLSLTQARIFICYWKYKTRNVCLLNHLYKSLINCGPNL